ncbi:MAG: TonB-dependent receptor [Pyrinomonadaceae bacterium MAG19_C2-C3]|nr:TonB-dependent receptor [Pyrinomonadaceae bacterium MAG19_C2-C3]
MKNAHKRTCFSLMLLPFLAVGVSTPASAVQTNNARTNTASAARTLGKITGIVRDAHGTPLEGALISVLQNGFRFGRAASRVVGETRSRADGTFLVRATPGSYEVQAQAAGFDGAQFSDLQVDSTQDLIVRFNLERSGSGRTMPERRADRDDAKWRVRAAHGQRSIFQIDDDGQIIVTNTANVGTEATGDVVMVDDSTVEDETTEAEKRTLEGRTLEGRARGDVRRPARGVVETYVATSADARRATAPGINFAIELPGTRRTGIALSAQHDRASLWSRIEARTSTRVNGRHRVRFRFGAAQAGAATRQRDFANDDVSEQSPENLSALTSGNAFGNNLNGEVPAMPFGVSRDAERGLSTVNQISARATDEWIVRDGIVVVLGLDYAQLFGANASAWQFSPRLGVRFDANARTRMYASLSSGEEADAPNSGISLENQTVAFKEPARATEFVTDKDGAAQLARSQRLEFGIERVLDGRSSITATAFFDTVDNRGIGLFALPSGAFRGDSGGAEMVGIVEQHGAARGVRVMVARRLNDMVKVAAGYSFGQGQSLDLSALNDFQDGDAVGAFRNEMFQVAAAQVEADVTDSTNVQAVVRFSPRATVFAIDPFAGGLAVYDPSLSILVTQELPTFGLPLRARAVVDARNLFHVTMSADDGGSPVFVGAMRRSVRGGIAVRF